MIIQPIAVVITFCILLVSRKECSGFRSSTIYLVRPSFRCTRPNHERIRRGPQHQLSQPMLTPNWASTTTTLPPTTPATIRSAARESSSLSAPDPSAYYPNDDSEKYMDGEAKHANVGGGHDNEQQQQFPDVSAWALGKEPKGIGTLFDKEGEVIRELSSDEYVDIVREWAPLASFAAKETPDPQMKGDAESILNVLRGMAEWEPRRNGDYTKEGSKWAFGAPIGAIKGGQVDAMACLQVSENGGVVIEWICSNPITLGVPGNAVDWLARGIEALCGKRLDLPVSVSERAKGRGEAQDDDGSERKAKGSSGSKRGPKKRR